MAGNEEPQSQETQRNDCMFEWDNDSQLYFHASSGFYHDPNAGWYFSSRDGHYYKFENGSYVLMDYDEGGEYNALNQRATISDEAVQDELVSDNVLQDELYQTECGGSDEPENLPPPSEWLEETLIDLYLSGYSNSEINVADDRVISTESDVGYDSKSLFHGEANDNTEEIEEGEWILEDLQDATESSGRISDEGTSWEEENWRAQYGQVIQAEEVAVPSCPITDLWDWAMVTATVVKKKRGKKKKYKVSRLIGKLVKPSTKLHPSMPSGGVLFKTAAICEVHHDLVRVSSGQVYRLKSPSLKYLASLSTYDSSDPTKDWGFPDISIDKQDTHSPNFGEKYEYEAPGVPVSEDSAVLSDQIQQLEKNKGCTYRDRAAERRALHGGFGVGPGQKGVDLRRSSSPVSHSTQEAAAEALNMSFGAGSFARRMLEGMGWKEGEALGKTTKGLVQPLEAVGNNGYAGLGWDHRRSD